MVPRVTRIRSAFMNILRLRDGQPASRSPRDGLMMPGRLTTIETTAVHVLLFPSFAQKNNFAHFEGRSSQKCGQKPRSDGSACPFRDRRKNACYAKGASNCSR